MTLKTLKTRMTLKKTVKGLVAGGTPRVNLLPPKEIENRANSAHWRRWRKAFIWAFVIVALAWVVGLRWNLLAHSDLDATRMDTEQLQSQLSFYSNVINLQAEVDHLTALKAEAGGNDQNWLRLISEIKSVLPDGVALIGFTLAPGPASVPGSEASEHVGLTGRLTFSAKATSAQAPTITQLRTLRGFIDVDAGTLSSAGPAGGFTFVTTFTADQTRYTGRFVPVGSK